MPITHDPDYSAATPASEQARGAVGYYESLIERGLIPAPKGRRTREQVTASCTGEVETADSSVKAFRERIAALKAKTGMDNKDVSELIGISTATIWRGQKEPVTQRVWSKITKAEKQVGIEAPRAPRVSRSSKPRKYDRAAIRRALRWADEQNYRGALRDAAARFGLPQGVLSHYRNNHAR